MRTFIGKIKSDMGSEVEHEFEFEFEVDDNATQAQIEEEAKQAAFDWIELSFHEL